MAPNRLFFYTLFNDGSSQPYQLHVVTCCRAPEGRRGAVSRPGSRNLIISTGCGARCPRFAVPCHAAIIAALWETTGTPPMKKVTMPQ
jgi:hypothetical protein